METLFIILQKVQTTMINLTFTGIVYQWLLE